MPSRDIMRLPVIEISWGEFFDRLTILQIKLQNISDPSRRAAVEAALVSLVDSGRMASTFSVEIQKAAEALREVNAKLWIIEESKRDCERRKDFGPKFISLARSVYIENDKRASLKRQIDLELGSRLIEVKSHKPY